MVRWAEVHQNKPRLSHLALKNCEVGGIICMVGASGTIHVLKCNLLIWDPNPYVIASLTAFLYIRRSMCIYMHINNYICLRTKYKFHTDSF